MGVKLDGLSPQDSLIDGSSDICKRSSGDAVAMHNQTTASNSKASMHAIAIERGATGPISAVRCYSQRQLHRMKRAIVVGK